LQKLENCCWCRNVFFDLIVVEKLQNISKIKKIIYFLFFSIIEISCNKSISIYASSVIKLLILNPDNLTNPTEAPPPSFPNKREKEQNNIDGTKCHLPIFRCKNLFIDFISVDVCLLKVSVFASQQNHNYKNITLDPQR